VIELKNVTKQFGSKTAVKNINLSIKKGEVFGFLGPNGAGKTTTMKMILGLARPTKGKILVGGKPAGSLEVRRNIGFLPEFSHFYQHLTGTEFLHFVGEIFQMKETDIEKRSKSLSKLVNLSNEAMNRAIGTYSKGMQQRIGMAQALMNDPDVIFLDEPMSGLDPIGRKELKDVIVGLKEQKKTIFFNSHILADAEQICDRVGIIHLGEILVNDTVETLMKGGKSLEDIFIETIKGKTPAKPKKAASKKTTTAQTKKSTKKPLSRK
jgi:ABC-2 type transport system ATP-binding protein